MANPVTANPNAVVGGGSGASLGLGVVWLLGKAGVSLDTYTAGLVVSGVSTLVLFIGRNGLAGVWRFLIHGGGK